MNHGATTSPPPVSSFNGAIRMIAFRESGPLPKAGIEFGPCCGGESVCIHSVAKHRENGGTGSTHQGGGGFPAIQQPLFEFGKEAVLLKHGTLQIIYQ